MECNTNLENVLHMMDDVWEDDASERDIMQMTSAKFEEQIRTGSFRQGVEDAKLDEEELLQEGFNAAFAEAAQIYRPLGQLKGTRR